MMRVWAALSYFYPRPPRGGRHFLLQRLDHFIKISIHALREEGDLERVTLQLISAIFLSTPSARRATGVIVTPRWWTLYFYPRPPRGGRPMASVALMVRHIDFYPRPPRGGRPAHKLLKWRAKNFYPRPPRGGRPLCQYAELQLLAISIHALREAGDPS